MFQTVTSIISMERQASRLIRQGQLQEAARLHVAIAERMTDPVEQEVHRGVAAALTMAHELPDES